jgi:hypothetical protein
MVSVITIGIDILHISDNYFKTCFLELPISRGFAVPLMLPAAPHLTPVKLK